MMSAAREELRITPATPYAGELEIWWAVILPIASKAHALEDGREIPEAMHLNFFHHWLFGEGAGGVWGALEHARLYPTRATAAKVAKMGGRRERAIKVAVPPHWGKRP